MSRELREMGQRLRAYRLGARLTAEEVADRLCLSRATVYRLEKTGITRLDTLERVGRLLNVSVASLLGVGVEYIQSAVTYFERLRQLESTADWSFVAFGPISYILTSAEYDAVLHKALLHRIPSSASDRERAVASVAETMVILARRKAEYARRRPAITSLLAASDIRYFARWGLGGPGIGHSEHREFVDAAHHELDHIADMLHRPPLGVQVGVLFETLPTTSFNIIRQGDRSLVSISPFRLGPHPNARNGVAMVTASQEAVKLYSDVAAELWSQAVTGAAAADFIRDEISKAKAKEDGKKEPDGAGTE